MTRDTFDPFAPANLFRPALNEVLLGSRPEMLLVDRPARRPVSVPVELEGDIVRHRAVTQNISPDGVFVATEYPAEIGDLVSLRFRLPGQTTYIVAEAEVRWVREESDLARGVAGMGLRFRKLPRTAAESIDFFLVEAATP